MPRGTVRIRRAPWVKVAKGKAGIAKLMRRRARRVNVVRSFRMRPTKRGPNRSYQGRPNGIL